MRAHTKANSGHASNHATSSPGVPFVMRWKFGPRGRDSRADQKDRGLWERNCGIICNLLKAIIRAGTEIHDAEDEKCSQINSVRGQ